VTFTAISENERKTKVKKCVFKVKKGPRMKGDTTAKRITSLEV